MKVQYAMFVDVLVSKQVCVSIICMTLHYPQLCQTQLIVLCVHHRFDDEVKDDVHSAFTPEIVSVCEYCWSIEGWIHSKRRNNLHQKLVEFG